MNNDPLIAHMDDPVHGTVHHPYSAYNQGWDAAEHGHALNLNPYEPDSREHRWWDMGWVEYGEGPDWAYDQPSPPPSATAVRRPRRYRAPAE